MHTEIMISRAKATIWWGLPVSIAFSLWMFNTRFRKSGEGYLSVEFGASCW